MFKKSLVIVIFLLTVSFIALIALQLYWIRSVVHLREDQFDANVSHILGDVANKVENNLVCFELFSKAHLGHGEGFYMVKQKWDSTGNKEHFVEPAFENERIRNLDTITTYWHYASKTDSLYSFNDLKFSNPASVEILLKFTYDQKKKAPHIDTELIDSTGIRNYTADEFQRLSFDQKPLKEKIDTALLDSLLHLELEKKGIPIGFRYAITEKGSDKVLFAKPSLVQSSLFGSQLRTGLFEKDHFNPPYELQIDFDGKTGYILSTITPVLIVSFLLIAILALIFWFAVRMVLKENKLAIMKNEFINNLTHEFKTPVSTIALATETINSPEILNDKSKLSNFLTVMKDESLRLEAQVERILQIGMLEKKELPFTRQRVSINEVISETVKSFELYSKIKDASIRLELDNEEPVLEGDETHLRNMMYNLLDNALKYSNGRKPEIIISTRRINSGLVLSVEDNGIGMNHREVRKVFDKFYRIPTGDIHNTKGFGLGLSYVKTIVALHRGKIKVASEPGEGTKFTIQFQSAI